MLQTGQIFVLEFKLKLWGWIRCPEVIQTAKPEAAPGLGEYVRVRWTCGNFFFFPLLLISVHLKIKEI